MGRFKLGGHSRETDALRAAAEPAPAAAFLRLEPVLVAYEADPNSVRLSPDNAARGIDVVGINNKRELIRYADGRNYVERCTGVGQVSDGTIDSTAAKRNLCRLQYPPTWCSSAIVLHGAPRE